MAYEMKFERYDDDQSKWVEDQTPRGGMTLRDWFAGQALTSCSSAKLLGAFQAEAGDTGKVSALIANYCYALADAILAEREK